MDANKKPTSPFPRTRWSIVHSAQGDDPEALAKLCGSYWFPLYAYARRRGSSSQDAEDLTQGFFLHIVSTEFFKQADQDLGRLRTLLLNSFRNYMAKDWRRGQAEKRGAAIEFVHIDGADAEARLALEPRDELTPEAEFDRCWGREILRRAREELRAEYESEGKLEEFDAYSGRLSESQEGRPYADIAMELGIKESTARYHALSSASVSGSSSRRQLLTPWTLGMPRSKSSSISSGCFQPEGAEPKGSVQIGEISHFSPTSPHRSVCRR